jgi:general secretion pathway protein E
MSFVQRFAAGTSSQHPLVRLAGLGLKRADTGTVLELEPLTEWLAAHLGLPYLRIDPLKVDVGRVAEVMSINYAERRSALPVQVGLTDLTIATCEPLDIAWIDEILAHTKKKIRLVVSSPLDLQRYRTEFYTLAQLRPATPSKKTGDAVAHNFEQLVELGRCQPPAGRQRPGHHPGGRLAVAIRVRPARLGHPSGAAARDGLPSASASTACCTPSTRCPWR